ncbi:hypothetical protein NliqN6_4349 [Naganishia liquefaciens]|uniref:Uncharacterized protein n=1 Tax=Naganishia liquefaciens TaxID=104408 RepID=A0A8H3TVL0_9TREE|nr:hypothetical protein NliqN6_4349 [Naganishia liquefaciens]
MSNISLPTTASTASGITQTPSSLKNPDVVYFPTTAPSFSLSKEPDDKSSLDATSFTIIPTPSTTLSAAADREPGDEPTSGGVLIKNPTGLFAELKDEDLEKLRKGVEAVFARHPIDTRSDLGNTLYTWLENFGQGLEDFLLSAVGLAKGVVEVLLDSTTTTLKVFTGQASFDTGMWQEYAIGTLVSGIVIMIGTVSVRFAVRHARQRFARGNGTRNEDIELGPMIPVPDRYASNGGSDGSDTSSTPFGP